MIEEQNTIEKYKMIYYQKMIDIRMAAEEDIPRILEIEHDAFSPPWPHGALLSEIYRDDSCFLVAEKSCDSDAPQLLGFIILRQVGDESELFQIAVDKQARGRGIANEMLQAATLWARNRNVKTVFLEARVSNSAAISLYHKNGFCDVGRRSKYFTQPVEDAFLMTLQL